MSLGYLGQMMVGFIQNNALLITFALLILNIFFLVLVLINMLSKRKVYKRYYNFIAGFEEKNLDYLLGELENRLNILDHRFADLDKISGALRRDLTFAVQQVGVVRFNAFPDVGSDLSFSVALLDNNSSGVVITSIYGREESRIFAKPIAEGTSTYRLTEEEHAALAKAAGRRLAV